MGVSKKNMLLALSSTLVSMFVQSTCGSFKSNATAKGTGKSTGLKLFNSTEC